MSNHDSITAASSVSPPGGARAGTKRERPTIEVNTGDPAQDGGSQQSTPASINGPDPKKRKSAPGSRGVANLTAEQLAKKRANGMSLLPRISLAWHSWPCA